MICSSLLQWYALKQSAHRAQSNSSQSAGLGLYILCTLSVINGLGHHINTLSPRHISTLARLQLFIAEFYVWTSTFLKLCLAWMIFRIQGNIAIWRRGLIAMMAFVATLAVACCLWDYLQCRPINALWDLSYSRDHCSLAAYHKWIYTASSMPENTSLS